MASRIVLGSILICLLSVSGCGGSPGAPPTAGPSSGATTATADASSSPASTSNAGLESSRALAEPRLEPVAPPSAATEPTKPPPVAVLAQISAIEETFPSGLVVDQRELGGPAPGPELPKGSKVLHIGDSFGGALGIELNKVLTQAGLKSRLEYETSTYIPTWAYSKKLPTLLQSFNPDLVLISLGANELENPEPEKRAPLIKRLVGSLGGRACVWIAPVLWEGAKSRLLEVISANVSPCVYLDSNRLVKKMPRAGDKIHPSMPARPDWALVTARWLAYHRKQAADRPWLVVPGT